MNQEIESSKPQKKFNRYARHKARRLALQALYQWDMAGNSIVAIEQEFLINNDMKKIDSDFFHELIHQIPAHLDHIQQQIIPFLDRDLKDLTPIELATLRIGVYELCYRPDIPYKVVINEALELAKIFGAEDGYKYVNGILDRVAHAVRKEEM